MIIYIPIFSDNLKSKTFSLKRDNPGVGGTQFTSIRLALLLSKACPEWKIILVNKAEINLENASSNIVQRLFDNPNIFFKSLDDKHDNLVIATKSILEKVNIEILEKTESSIICWSHHPFDRSIKKLVTQIKLKGVVCVGTYQFYSNANLSKQLFHIQNPFFVPKGFKKQKQYVDPIKKEINVVYIGALVPGKGFLEVAKSWPSLKLIAPKVRLHVIGSNATYGAMSESSLIPAKLNFVEKILKFIPERDICDGEVIFYGNLGEEKFDVIQQCHIAILNPTGVTEAFPASPLECMACGVPVITSDDYGMSDCMRFFPELVVRGHRDIAKRVAWTISDPLRYKELQQRSIAVAKWFDAQNDQIVTRWIRLISAIRSDSQESIELLPVMTFYGSRAKLIYRQKIRPLVNSFKLFCD